MLADMLRDYQADMLHRLERAWARHRSVMVQMPTGTGKTVLMAEAVRNEKLRIKNEKFILVVAHRRELIEQICRTLERNGIGDVTVTSIQKLARGAAPGSGAPSLVIIDEAHHALAKTYRMLWDWWPEARFLGLTATPCRLNGAAFTDLFDVLLQSWPIQTFIDKGWLSDFEYISAAPDNPMLEKVNGLKKRGADGDYQTKEMVAVMDVEESIAHLYKTYAAFANGKKGIVYAIDRQHAEHIASYYAERGVRCAVIDSRTPAKEREKLVEAYRSTRGVRHLGDIASDITEVPDPSVPPIDVLVNVDIFGEGFDVPEVEFIQLARPTLSLSKYLQQVGRGMRVSEGKPYVMILDNVGLYHVFGLPTDERDWNRTFLGQTAGKGLTGQEPMLVVEEDCMQHSASGNMLVNLEMVRVKRRGETRKGVEVFLQGGKYGVMMDGRVTCPAEFVNISRLEKDGAYYALATYPYYVYKNRQTVIDRHGTDLKAKLYGKVTREGDFFRASDLRGTTVWFDGIGRKEYHEKPRTSKFRYVDLIDRGDGWYALRRQVQGGGQSSFRMSEVLYNDDLVIVKDLLLVKGDNEHVYRVMAYMDDSILAGNGNIYDGVQQIFYDGRRGTHFSFQQVKNHSFKPDLQALRLRRMT